MSDGKIGFLPWVQRGLINYTQYIEGASVSPPIYERAKLRIKLTATPTFSTIKDFQLTGPGDAIGIDHSMVIRTEPATGVFNFSDNLMPYIEFAEIDFPWQLTPAKAEVLVEHLSSWLALVVLKDDEYTLLPPAAEGLPERFSLLPISSPPITFGQYFHPHNEHWAWAHVQVNRPLDSAPPSGTETSYFLNQQVGNDPTAGTSRLLCPRRLEADTQYTAFLIPAFETGRLAGVGITALSSVPHTKRSWDTIADIEANAANNFPIYYKWRFGTAIQGDFETLVRNIVPRTVAPSMGGIKMDISNSGMGLNSLFVSPGPDTVSTVNMEGALMPDGFTSPTPQSVSTVAPTGLGEYTGELLDILNLNTDLKDNNVTVSGPLASTPPENPFIPGATYATDDPVVLPPMYGQWHANINKLTTSSPLWVQQLNLDVRYRAAAGLGSKVVKDNQEQFMETAWEQIGEVLKVNDMMAKGKLAETVSKQIFRKHYVGNSLTTVPSAMATEEEKMNNTIRFGSKFFGKIRNDGVPPPVPGPPVYISPVLATNGLSIKSVLSRSLATKGSIDGGFRKIIRNQSHAVSKLALAAENKTLIHKISDAANPVKAAPLTMADPKHTMLPAELTAMATFNAPATMFSGSVTTSGITYSKMAVFQSSVYIRSFHAFKKMLEDYDDIEETFERPANIPITPSAIVTKVRQAIDPAVTISERIRSQLSYRYNDTAAPITNLNSIVMAYPVIDDPAYEYLVKMSKEYLLPNAAEYANNSVTLLKSNNRFIEAFMAGMNHEFSKELMWRGYPTDQRGSYFRRFWDTNDTYRPSGTGSDYLYDIDRIHRWNTVLPLGGNNVTTRHSSSGGLLILLIKADLLKKYPNTLIYAQKAKWSSSAAPSSPPAPVNSRLLEEDVLSTSPPDTPIDSRIQFPVFRAQLDPDIVLLGFRLSASAVKGDETEVLPSGMVGDPGWFFVFRERPGQLAFGMDAAPTPTSSPAYPALSPSWANLSWGHMQTITGIVVTDYFQTARMSLVSGHPVAAFTGEGLRWNNNTTPTITSSPPPPSNSAHVASILLQDPVMAAIHAGNLLL